MHVRTTMLELTTRNRKYFPEEGIISSQCQLYESDRTELLIFLIFFLIFFFKSMEKNAYLVGVAHHACSLLNSGIPFRSLAADFTIFSTG